MKQALALVEFGSVATGVLAVDRLLKKAPVASLQCGIVQPGKYLVRVTGSVASVEEAHTEACAVGRAEGTLLDEVFLPDPHREVLVGQERDGRRPAGEALGVVETATSPALLRWLDRALKRLPIELVETRLGDDLGGRAVALIDGILADIQEAVELATAQAAVGGATGGHGVRTSVLPRLEAELQEALGAGLLFRKTRPRPLAGAEVVED